MILSICDEPSLMNVARIVVLLINIIKVTVPIILIVFLMIKIMGAVSKHDQEEIMKTVRSSVPNIIAAVLIFLIPTFVDMVARLSFPNSDYSKCISGITKEKIEIAYDNKMSELVSIAENSLKFSDYSVALGYLQNIKDSTKREHYSQRLDTIKEKIDKKEQQENKKNNYALVNYSNFKWHLYNSGQGPANKYYSGVLPYMVWAPDNINDLNGVSLPVIVWLHGAGELSYNISLSEYRDRSLPKVIKKWKKTGLQDIPAIIIAPQVGGSWASNEKTRDNNLKSIVAMMESVKEIYNADLTKAVLMGHSWGARGVTEVAYEMKQKYSFDYFYKYVVFSGGEGLIYPSSSSENARTYFSSIEIKGYGEPKTKSGKFFDWINKPNNYKIVSNADHGTIIYYGMILDEDKDGISDLVYWLFGKNEKGNSSNVDYSSFKWTYYDKASEPLASYYSDTMPYAIYGPENLSELNNVKLPLIIWLHGAVGTNKYCPKGAIEKHRFIKTIANWSSSGLEPIPAIIMAPQHCDSNDGSWRSKIGIETIKAMIKYATDVYNIDKSKIVLMGHSDGGSGVVYVSRGNQELFSALVVMSGFQDFNAYADYYKRIPLRGYMTLNPARASDANGGGDGNTGMERAFEQIGRSKDLIKFPKNVTHDEVQEKAFTTDSNNNGKSDLIEWIVSGFK